MKKLLTKIWNWIKKNPEAASFLPALIIPSSLNKWLGVIPCRLAQNAINIAQEKVRMSDASKRQLAASIIKLGMKERFGLDIPDNTINFMIELLIAQEKAAIGPREPK